VARGHRLEHQQDWKRESLWLSFLWLLSRVLVHFHAIMSIMTAMIFMHKEHHEWTEEQKGVGKKAKQMSSMFRDQEKADNGKKTKQDPGGDP
jgi:hypothetical protein